MAARLVTDDPIERFQEWFREAEQAGVEVPETMTLATAGAGGAPSARMVLLKGADDEGFVFYSGYESRKAGELDKMLSKVADFYEDEVDAAVGALTSIIEPLMMLGVGAIVGVIIISMYMPMFKMLQAIH